MGQFNTFPVRKLAILGSTGSIGRQTLDIVRAFPNNFQIIALAGGQNLDLLKRQAKEFCPRYINFSGEKSGTIEGMFIELDDMASLPDADIIINAISGTAGLSPALAAVQACKDLALANKESIVMAGQIISDIKKNTGARLLPVDSEPSAIWQCLRGEDQNPRRIILTASGGPFLNFTREQLEKVSVEQALKHPSWNMGRKITIDSATLMNKGLEVIEAHWLFDMDIDNIKILIHPQSIIHSMVEFVDGTIKAQLSNPDMRFPILHALSYPVRLESKTLPEVEWDLVNKLTFEVPQLEKFPCLKLAVESGKKGGTCPAALCGADEMAVELFLSNRIKFTDISMLLEKVMMKHKNNLHPSIQEIKDTGNWGRDELRSLAGV